MDSILIINKPLYLTSMDVIRKIRKKLNIKKVGHAGTLDPLATGVLIVCTGKSTKKISSFMDLPKEYVTTIDLAHVSTTHDGEGEVTPADVEKIPTQEELLKVLEAFTGDILQVPPRHSAIKVNGKVAYKMARNNKEFTMPPRHVTVHNIELINYEWPLCTIKINCSKGTYIRSLGRDIGRSLNTGGYLIKLERTAIGEYTIDQSVNLTDFIKGVQ